MGGIIRVEILKNEIDRKVIFHYFFDRWKTNSRFLYLAKYIELSLLEK